MSDDLEGRVRFSADRHRLINPAADEKRIGLADIVAQRRCRMRRLIEQAHRQFQ